MYCISCGSKLPENARYCAQCGAKVPNLVEDTEANEEAADVIDVEAIVNADEEEARVEAEGALEACDAVSERKTEDKSSDETSEDDVADAEAPSRQASGPLDLPEIDPAAPYASSKASDDAPYDPFAEQPVPFKPSYGPLKSADIEFSLDGDTAKMPRILSESGEVLVEGDSAVRNFVQSNTVPKRWTPAKVALLVFMIAVAIALVGVIVWIQTDRSVEIPSVSSASQQNQPEETVTNVSGSGSDAQSQSQDQDEMSEDERLAAVFAELESAYDAVGTLNDEVAKAVDDYNTYYVDPDLEDRTAASDRCSALMDSIADAKSSFEASLSELGCESGDPYYEQANSIIELFDLLDARVSPLVESWARSVASSSPSSDESYILEPIAQANSDNVLSQFNSLYSSSAPEAVR